MEREDPGREWSTDLGQRGERGETMQSVKMPDGKQRRDRGWEAMLALGHGHRVVGGASVKSTTFSRSAKTAGEAMTKKEEYRP